MYHFYLLVCVIYKHTNRIFRHMRLSANFVNLEVTVTGVPKLRIPTTLLREKQRTAKRFSVTRI
jgi:hypothetical protein